VREQKKEAKKKKKQKKISTPVRDKLKFGGRGTQHKEFGGTRERMERKGKKRHV